MRRDRAAERAAAERDELNRRLDWLEQHGYCPNMETVIENMQAELGQPTINRDHAYLARTR